MARGLLIAFLLSFGPAVSNSFARFAYALLLPAMRADLHWNYAQSGSINTFNAAGYLVGALFTRALVGRLGNRALFCAGMLLTSLALLATGMVRELDLLIAARVVAGIGGAAAGKVKAGELVNFVAQQVGGKGGGKPDLAMAGGTDAAALPAALASVAGWVGERV